MKKEIITTLEHKKVRARRLYVLQCKTAKETAATVGATEKTIGKWVKDFKWKEQREKNIARRMPGGDGKKHSAILVLTDLKFYLNENCPHLAGKIEDAIDNYIHLLK